MGEGNISDDHIAFVNGAIDSISLYGASAHLLVYRFAQKHVDPKEPGVVCEKN